MKRAQPIIVPVPGATDCLIELPRARGRACFERMQERLPKLLLIYEELIVGDKPDATGMNGDGI